MHRKTWPKKKTNSSKLTKPKKRSNEASWRSYTQRHVMSSGTGRVRRCIEENVQDIGTQSEETFNKLATMFPPSKDPDRHLPIPEPIATKYAHVHAIKVRERLMEMQGSVGISQSDVQHTKKFSHSIPV